MEFDRIVISYIFSLENHAQITRMTIEYETPEIDWSPFECNVYKWCLESSANEQFFTVIFIYNNYKGYTALLLLIVANQYESNPFDKTGTQVKCNSALKTLTKNVCFALKMCVKIVDNKCVWSAACSHTM